MKNLDAPQLPPPAPGAGGLSPLRLAPRLPGQAWGLLVALLEMPFRYLFGRDLFISYSRSDSRKYAPNLALALQKRRPKLSFYLDRWIAPPSGKLPLSLRLQLRWSSILLVVCTERAVGSPFVQDEVARFARLGRKVLTVDVDGAFNAVRGEEPWVGVSGADPEEESGAAVESGEPSEHVVERALKMVEFTTQDRRLRRAVWGTLAFVLLSVGGIGAYGYDANLKATEAEARAAEANAQADAAAVREREAEEKAADAEAKAASAAVREANAKKAQDTAEAKALDAEGKAATAEGLRADAERKAGEALEKERDALAEAQKQERIALARRLSAENNLAADPQSEEMEKKILLTVESMRRFPSLESYSNLVEGVRMMPLPHKKPASHPDEVSGLTFSPDGKYMATLAGGVLWLRQADALASGGEIGEAQRMSREGERINGVVFSPDGKYVAAAHMGGVRLWLTGEMRELAPIAGKGFPMSLFNGGGGNFIAVVKGDPAGVEGRSDIVGVWQLEGDTAREVASVTTGSEVAKLSFSPDSKFFTTFTDKDGDMQLNFWLTTGGAQSRPAAEPLRMGGSALSAGFSPNAKYLWAVSDTADLSISTLLKADTRESVLDGLRSHQFSPNGRFLVTTTADSEFASISGTEVWDASGDSLEKLHSLKEAFGAYRFSRDGKRLAQVIGRESVKVWNTLSGQVVAYVKLKAEYKDLAFTPDGRFLAVAAGRDVTLWPLGREWKSYEFDHRWNGPTALSPDGQLIAAANETDLSILNAADGREVWSIQTPCPVESVSFGREGERVVTRGSCGAWAWRTGDGQQVARVGDPQEPFNRGAFIGDGRYAAVEVEGGVVEVREIANPSNAVRLEGGEAVRPEDDDAVDDTVLGAAFSDDGSLVAIARLGKIDVWNWRTRRLLHSVVNGTQGGGDFNSLAVAFDEDDNLITADIYEALVWDLRGTPRVVGRVELQDMRTTPNFHTTLSPNGRFVASTLRVFGAKDRPGYNRTTVWQLRPADVWKNACSRLESGSLSETDWKKEFGGESFRETCLNANRPAGSSGR